jgi:hypothetical protein
MTGPALTLGMSVQEAIDLAKARCAELGATVPGTTSLMIQRLSQYEQRLYALGAQWNPDYFGTCIVGTLDGYKMDLLALIDPLEICETITRVEVADAGTSPSLSAGDEIAVVTLSDRDAEIPPRCTIRRKVLAGVGTDLLGVAAVRVFYSPSPVPIPVSDPASLAYRTEVPHPHDGLWPLDLTLYLLDKLPTQSEAVVAGRAAIVAEQAAALAAFEAHVRSFVMTTRTRFGSEPHAPPTRAK